MALNESTVRCFDAILIGEGGVPVCYVYCGSPSTVQNLEYTAQIQLPCRLPLPAAQATPVASIQQDGDGERLGDDDLVERAPLLQLDVVPHLQL